VGGEWDKEGGIGKEKKGRGEEGEREGEGPDQV